MERGNPSMSVVQRFAEVSPDEFKAEINTLWEAGRHVVDTIIDQVEEGRLTPIQALGIVGCTTSQLYGYNAFHGNASPADLASALISPDRLLTR